MRLPDALSRRLPPPWRHRYFRHRARKLIEKMDHMKRRP